MTPNLPQQRLQELAAVTDRADDEVQRLKAQYETAVAARGEAMRVEADAGVPAAHIAKRRGISPQAVRIIIKRQR